MYVRIDYCNSLLYGLPDYFRNRLQKNSEQCCAYFWGKLPKFNQISDVLHGMPLASCRSAKSEF